VCCGPILVGTTTAATAEALMRSRFTAHVANDQGFLHRTFLPTARLPYVPKPGEPVPRWTRLIVHRHGPGPSGNSAWVDFSAYYVENGAELALHEKSEFSRVGGEWLYVGAVGGGPARQRVERTKARRNDPCPCGSGHKFKQCCLDRP
jgi:SEC-C motif-containing protein